MNFKKNESFYIRDGWFEKAIITLHDSEEQPFFKNKGNKIFGIGTNMVKSLKYWLLSSNVIEKKGSNYCLSTLGNLVYQYDKYLTQNFAWYFIHYNICLDKDNSPIFNFVFLNNLSKFTKDDIVTAFIQKFPETNQKYIDDDTNIFLKTYYNDTPSETPEDNFFCPLSNLKLLEKKGNYYLKKEPKDINALSLVCYYYLQEKYKNKSFNIEEAIYHVSDLLKIFNIERNLFYILFDRMKNLNLITINKTAGLNVVYFNKKLTLEDIFYIYFGRN